MKMRRTIWLTLAVAINVITAVVSHAQTNSCISSTDGFWDEARIWSLAAPPSIKQSTVLITNAASETITIDSTTATHFKSTLTISNLSVSAPSGSIDTLSLDNTGVIALHILNELTIGITSDTFPGGAAELLSTNSTLVVDGLFGGQLLDYGAMVVAGGSLVTTNCSLVVGASFSPAVGSLFISNGMALARDVSIVAGEDAIGTIEIVGGTMTLSSYLSVGGNDTGSQGNLFVANGSLLVVTNDTTYIGEGFECSGSITITDATMIASDIVVGDGFQCGGDLIIESGTITLRGSLEFGAGSGGDVLLDGGSLIVTNGPTTIAGENGSGEITIEEGSFLAREILVGSAYHAGGVLTVNGGTTHLNSYLQVGGTGFSDGAVFVNGGQLVVTNGDTILTKYGASITVTGGLLAADHIIMSAGKVENGVASITASLSVNNGFVTATTGITLGDCASDGVGQIILDGGQLTVTNAAHTGFIDIQNGQLVLSSGLLQVDKLVMTNTCSSFVHTGGTLIVGSVILDPNAFQITSVAREGNDLLISWLMAPGQTNALQVSSGGPHGAYTTNTFTDLFIVTNNTTTGSLTNYLDIGAATNTPSRYYRARLSP